MAYSVMQLKMLMDIHNIQQRQEIFYDGIVNQLKTVNRDTFDVKSYITKLSTFFPQNIIKINYVQNIQTILTMWKNKQTFENVQAKFELYNKIQQILIRRIDEI